MFTEKETLLEPAINTIAVFPELHINFFGMIVTAHQKLNMMHVTISQLLSNYISLSKIKTSIPAAF